MKNRKTSSKTLILLTIIICLLLSSCDIISAPEIISPDAFDYSSVPEYSGSPYIAINSNVTYFSQEEITKESYLQFGELDYLGRCTIANTCLGPDTLPSDGEERGDIGSVKPSGWNMKKYDCVNTKYVVNRAHLAAWSLSNMNAEERNLITGTRYLNVDGMLPFESMVLDFIRETGYHVMYRVTPIFVDNELMSRGVLMEGLSVEDNGSGISYCVFCYNVQPGIEFDYATGDSHYTGIFLDKTSSSVNADSSDVPSNESSSEVSTYVLNTKSMKYHLPDCGSVNKISDTNKEVFEGSKDKLNEMGYSPCGSCKP